MKTNNLHYFFVLTLLPFLVFAQSTIDGKVIDGEFNDVLPFANVILYSQSEDGNLVNLEGSTTDFDGNFSFSDLPAGVYTIDISFVGYSTVKISDIVLKVGDVVPISVTLQPASSELEEVVVTTTQKRNNEASVLSIQKNAAVVLDGLSLQAIRRAGDGDIAQAVRRVPGVSIQEGKYVYVRGLGDRYSKTLLNGMEIPGLDPDRNTLQLDIFPTNLIDNIQVLKSGNASYDADFSGGIVDLSLRDFSSTPLNTFTVGVGYNPDMHFNSDYVYDEGSKTDIFGFDDGYRKFPLSRGIDIPLPERGNLASLNVTSFTQNVDKNLNVSNKSSSPNLTLGFTSSNSYDLKNERKVGYMASLNYRSNISYFDDYLESRYEKSLPAFANTVYNTGKLGKDERFISFLGGIAYGSKKGKQKINFLFIQNGESTAIQGDFLNNGENNYDGVGQIKSYVQRQIISIPFSSKNYFLDGKLEANLSFTPTFSRVYDKDFKTSIFNRSGNGDLYFSRNGAGLPVRIWRDLEESSYNGRFNLIYKHNLGGISAETSVGGFYLRKQREFATEFFTIDYVGSTLDLNGNANNLLNNIWALNDPTGAFLFGTFQEENQFDSTIEKSGAYISEELNFSEKFKTYLGVRLENYTIFYTGESLDNIIYSDEQFINTSDLFPSVNMIYSLDENRKIRASYYKTTARPSFKENSAAVIFDPVTFNRFFGNVSLNPTYINNFDLRFEKYGESGNFFAVSGFYKNFQDPIEIVMYQRSPRQFRPQNSEEANVFGLEVELRQKILNNDIYNLGLNVNASVIESRQKLVGDELDVRQFDADALGVELDEYRRLQGQSPYLLNTSLVYKRNSSELSLFYNVQGKTLMFVGNDDVSDVFSVPFHSLNLIVRKSFGKEEKQQIQLEVQNILGDVREVQYEFFNADPVLFSQRKLGRTFAVTYRIQL